MATVWGFTSHPEEGYSGSFETRDAAIHSGRVAYPGEAFFVCGGRRPKPSEFLPDIDGMLENMGEAAFEEAGECAEDGFDCSPEARSELNQLLKDWADRRLVCDFWIADGEPEKVELLP